jgi:hypothetical protein
MNVPDEEREILEEKEVIESGRQEEEKEEKKPKVVVKEPEAVPERIVEKPKKKKRRAKKKSIVDKLLGSVGDEVILPREPEKPKEEPQEESKKEKFNWIPLAVMGGVVLALMLIIFMKRGNERAQAEAEEPPEIVEEFRI